MNEKKIVGWVEESSKNLEEINEVINIIQKNTKIKRDQIIDVIENQFEANNFVDELCERGVAKFSHQIEKLVKEDNIRSEIIREVKSEEKYHEMLNGTYEEFIKYIKDLFKTINAKFVNKPNGIRYTFKEYLEERLNKENFISTKFKEDTKDRIIAIFGDKTDITFEKIIADSFVLKEKEDKNKITNESERLPNEFQELLKNDKFLEWLKKNKVETTGRNIETPTMGIFLEYLYVLCMRSIDSKNDYILSSTTKDRLRGYDLEIKEKNKDDDSKRKVDLVFIPDIDYFYKDNYFNKKIEGNYEEIKNLSQELHQNDRYMRKCARSVLKSIIKICEENSKMKDEVRYDEITILPIFPKSFYISVAELVNEKLKSQSELSLEDAFKKVMSEKERRSQLSYGELLKKFNEQINDAITTTQLVIYSKNIKELEDKLKKGSPVFLNIQKYIRSNTVNNNVNVNAIFNKVFPENQKINFHQIDEKISYLLSFENEKSNMKIA